MSIDYFTTGTCQWMFCKNGGTCDVRATRYDRVGHRTVTHCFNACPEHEEKVITELRREYRTVKTLVRS